MFNAKERQDASEDEFSEYTDINLQKFMTSDLCKHLLMIVAML